MPEFTRETNGNVATTVPLTSVTRVGEVVTDRGLVMRRYLGRVEAFSQKSVEGKHEEHLEMSTAVKTGYKSKVNTTKGVRR
jgi:hypothetical protein